ncbi:MAG: DEAD/DEAH box helicase family protein [Myxococcota bacterium]
MRLTEAWAELRPMRNKTAEEQRQAWTEVMQPSWVGPAAGGSSGYQALFDEFDTGAVEDRAQEWAAENGDTLQAADQCGVGRGRKTLERVRVVGVEFDGETIAEQAAKLTAAAADGLPAPTSVVFSGRRSLHVLWRLADDVEVDADTARRAMRGLQVALRSDPGAVGVPRRWRAGGYDRDGEPQSVLVLGPEAGQEVIDWGLARAPAEENKTVQRERDARGEMASFDGPLASASVLAKAAKWLREEAQPSVEESTQSKLFGAIAGLANRGVLNVEQIVSLIEEHYNPRCTYRDGRPWPWIRRQIEFAATVSKVRAKEIEYQRPLLDKAAALEWTQAQIRKGARLDGRRDPDELIRVRDAIAEFGLTNGQMQHVPKVKRGWVRRGDVEAKVDQAKAAREAVEARRARLAAGERTEDLRGPTINGLEEGELDPATAEATARRLVAAGHGVVGLKSPMGKGKTLAITEYLAQTDPPSVLIPTPTIAQADELARRLDAEHYRAIDEDGLSVVRPRRELQRARRLVICLDSLHLVADVSWHTIVIDEIEDVLHHLDGETIEPDFVQHANSLLKVLEGAQVVLEHRSIQIAH